MLWRKECPHFSGSPIDAYVENHIQELLECVCVCVCVGGGAVFRGTPVKHIYCYFHDARVKKKKTEILIQSILIKRQPLYKGHLAMMVTFIAPILVETHVVEPL